MFFHYCFHNWHHHSDLLSAYKKAIRCNLNAITEAFFKHVVSTNRIDFPLEDSFENSENTPADMTGEKLKKEMIKTGYDKTYATEHKEAYNNMLKAKKEGKLTRW